MEHKKTLHCMAGEGHVGGGHRMGHRQLSPCPPHWMSLKGYPILFRTRPPVKSGRSHDSWGGRWRNRPYPISFPGDALVDRLANADGLGTCLSRHFQEELPSPVVKLAGC